MPFLGNLKEFGKTANFRIAKQNELKDSEE
jgi:hypothetical protein